MAERERAPRDGSRQPEGSFERQTLEGTVVSQQANFYYVQVEDQEIACHMRGRLKKEGETPVVGDRVVIHLEPPVEGEKLPPPREGSLALAEGESEPFVPKGFIDAVLPRRTLLRKPTIANVDQVLLVFAADQPEFNPFLLDKLLVTTACGGFAVIVVINKRDLVPQEVLDGYVRAYAGLGYTVVTTEASVAGVADLLPHLAHKVSVLAGPSGVGKSSLLNAVQPGLMLRTGEVSDKLQRGRHTTRHAALFPITAVREALVADTPGFSFLESEPIEPAELGWHFPEMVPHIPDCRYPSCLHVSEPDCAVKGEAVITEARYDSYLRLLDELQAMKRGAAERSSKEEAGFKRTSGRSGAEKRLVKVDAASREGDRRTRKQRLLAELDTSEDEDDLEA